MTRLRQVLYKFFVDGALLKALALGISIVLFFVVRGDKDAAAGANVKVIYLLPEDRVLVNDPVSDVRLGIRGPWTRVSRLDERDLDAIRIDLSHFKGDGDMAFTEDLVKLPLGLRLASITPPSVHLRFETKVVRSVPVQVILEGEPLSGYRVAKSEVHPSQVKLSGAKSLVEAIQRARTRPFRITDGKDVLQGEVALEAPPPHATWEGGGQVTVEVVIVQTLAEKTLRAATIVVTGANRLDARLEPATADVVLRGPAAALAQVGSGSPSLIVDAQTEDTRPPGAYRKRISIINLPQGVAAEVRPEEVMLVTKRR